MIIHGNKQISERWYARKASEGGGAVAISNIIRGAQVVFGGLYPKVTWLYPQTRAAILAAFGQTDGKAVIKATNAYLNALAATDPTKASALAGFINATPTIAPWICGYYEPNAAQYPFQLGLKESRNFGFVFGPNDILEFSFIKLKSSSRWFDFLTARQEWNSANAIGYIYNWENNSLLVSTTSGSSQSSCLNPSMNTWYTIKQDMRSGIYVDGVKKISNTKSSSWQSDGPLSVVKDADDRISMNFINVYRNYVLIHRYYPIDDTGTWWDVVGKEFTPSIP